MAAVKLFKKSDWIFEPYGDDPKKASLSRLIGPELSQTMGAGIARFDGSSIAWTVLYDELIVTLEGTFRLRVGDEVIEARPGDVIWIPEKTPLFYEGDAATILYVVYPVDWKSRQMV